MDLNRHIQYLVLRLLIDRWLSHGLRRGLRFPGETAEMPSPRSSPVSLDDTYPAESKENVVWATLCDKTLGPLLRSRYLRSQLFSREKKFAGWIHFSMHSRS